MKEVNKHEWNNYIASQPHAQFLQSWEWGQFQESLGFPVRRVGVWTDQGIFAAGIQFQKISMFGSVSYLYAPRGPVEVFPPEFLSAVREKREVFFIRYEPSPTTRPTVRKDETSSKQGRRVLSIQPEREWFLDLTKSEEELFLQMHPKTRYNIRLASKKDVRVRIVDPSKDNPERHVDILVGFLKKTAGQKDYRLHRDAYYHSLITSFTQNAEEKYTHEMPYGLLYEATLHGEIVASVYIVYFGDTAYYLYGGSDAAYASIMAPYALHVFAWNDARKRGYRYYNFGGIAPDGVDRHPLSGITRFKMGFGGEHILYPGTFDSIVNYPGYMVYTAARSLLRTLNHSVHATVV